MNRNVGDSIYCSHFDFRVFFIGYCLSEQIKKIKFETDGTFDSIYVRVGDIAPNYDIENNAFTSQYVPHSKGGYHCEWEENINPSLFPLLSGCIVREL